jgi:uncharacterized SAM-binding protein YcdF (DUF218 family)
MSFFLKELLLPPGLLLLALIVGLLVVRRRWDLGWWLAVGAAAALYVLSTPLGAGGLSRVLETHPPLSTTEMIAGQAQAIVILGGDGDYTGQSGEETIGPQTLARLHYGAWLHGKTGLPILVSGGVLEDGEASLASEMKRALEVDYGILDVWAEAQSRNTWENAVDSAAILRAKNVERILLVTHARDMARALAAFLQTGLHVQPAPMGFDERKAVGLRSLLPSPRSLLASYYALYEIAGGVEYRLIHPSSSRSSETGAK